MKTLNFLAPILALFVLLSFACNKDDDQFCINNLSVPGAADIAEDVTIIIPGGETYTGVGAVPGPKVQVGPYSMTVASVILKQTPNENGMEVELVHLWDDGNGNAFWTDDLAQMTPLDSTLTLFNVYDEMTVVDGTGDFKCASGLLINNGTANFATGRLDYLVTGNVCGGCD